MVAFYYKTSLTPKFAIFDNILERNNMQRDKRLNTPEFNRKVKKRRVKKKHDAKTRKINLKKK